MSVGMDRRLSMKEFVSLKMHLFMCGACAQVLKQLRGLRRLLRAYHKHLLTKSTASSLLSQAAKNTIKQLLAAQSK